MPFPPFLPLSPRVPESPGRPWSAPIGPQHPSSPHASLSPVAIIHLPCASPAVVVAVHAPSMRTIATRDAVALIAPQRHAVSVRPAPPAPPQVAQVFRIGHPPRCAGRERGVGVARLPDSLVGVSGGAPGSTPHAAAIDAAPACGRATIRHELDEVGEADSGTRRPPPAATAPRCRRPSPSPPCAGPTCSHGEPAPGTRVATTDNGSDNVNSHEPNRNPRPRPSARRLAKEIATRARRLRPSARRHRPPPGPAAVGKEAP